MLDVMRGRLRGKAAHSRFLVLAAAAGISLLGVPAHPSAVARAAEALNLSGAVIMETIVWSRESFAAWNVISGEWTLEPSGGADPPRMRLVQRATANAFNVAVMPGPEFRDVDVSVRFQPRSGREDASGGIVFRFHKGRYYVVRANALEDNFRLYVYDGTRHELDSARTRPPALGAWHTLRVVAVGNRIQAYLDGALLLDHRDDRLLEGTVGLWTKADSVTAFEGMTVRGVPPRP
jgi:hypothetical protein